MIKRVFITSYAAQGYMSLLGIAFMPLYMRYMGVEAFGLVGFFFMLQVWLQLLDLGLSSTFSREMSLYRAGTLDIVSAWQRLHCLEWLLGFLALTAVATLMFSQDAIASRWLRSEYLSSNEVAQCIGAMAIAAALRWLMGLYRAGLVGLELQMWVAGAGSLFATLKFAGVVPVLAYWSAAPLTFFYYQAIAGALEFFAFAWRMHRALPRAKASFFPTWEPLQEMLPIAGAMAFMSGMWVFLTQIDKLILSRFLPLKEYGYFTLAVAAASGVLMLMTPLSQVLQPRMTILASQGLASDLCGLYRQATQLVTAAFFTLGGTLALFAEPVLFMWTGDINAARAAAPVLFWYGWANALTGLLVVPFMLQFAYGYLRLHVIGNVILGCTLLPFLVYAGMRFGGIGAGATLAASYLLFLLLWVPLVHRRLLPDMVWTWPLYDVGLVAVPVLFFLELAHWLFPLLEGRLLSASLIGMIFLGALLSGMLSGGYSRKLLVNWVGGRT